MRVWQYDQTMLSQASAFTIQPAALAPYSPAGCSVITFGDTVLISSTSTKGAIQHLALQPDGSLMFQAIPAKATSTALFAG